MTYDICVIGSEVLIYPFLQFGFATYTPKDQADLRRYIEKIIRENYGVVYIEDSYCMGIKDLLDQYRYSQTPIFVPIGESAGGNSYSQQIIEELMEKAIGISLG